jgi:hypothetical protein
MAASGFSDDYIVRIYRRNSHNIRHFIGTVEEVGTKGRRAFATVEELWEILGGREEQKQEKDGQSS